MLGIKALETVLVARSVNLYNDLCVVHRILPHIGGFVSREVQPWRFDSAETKLRVGILLLVCYR